MKGMDLIFCCNVLIYFDIASKAPRRPAFLLEPPGARLLLPRPRRIALPGHRPIPPRPSSRHHHLSEGLAGLGREPQAMTAIPSREMQKRVEALRSLPSSPAVLKPLLDLLHEPPDEMPIDKVVKTRLLRKNHRRATLAHRQFSALWPRQACRIHSSRRHHSRDPAHRRHPAQQLLQQDRSAATNGSSIPASSGATPSAARSSAANSPNASATTIPTRRISLACFTISASSSIRSPSPTNTAKSSPKPSKPAARSTNRKKKRSASPTARAASSSPKPGPCRRTFATSSNGTTPPRSHPQAIR